MNIVDNNEIAGHVVTIEGKKQIVNVTKEREEILKYLPSECQKYY